MDVRLVPATWLRHKKGLGGEAGLGSKVTRAHRPSYLASPSVLTGG